MPSHKSNIMSNSEFLLLQSFVDYRTKEGSTVACTCSISTEFRRTGCCSVYFYCLRFKRKDLDYLDELGQIINFENRGAEVNIAFVWFNCCIGENRIDSAFTV